MTNSSATGESRDRPVHIPVLLRETLQALELTPGLIVVDGTVGAGGHSTEILKRIGPTGQLIGIDRDPMMLQFAANRLSTSNCHLIQDTYAHLPQILAGLGLPAVDRILVDLGLSSDQLSDRERGFSFQSDGPLDLRFDPSQGRSAADWLADVELAELTEILERYAEEPRSAALARALIQARQKEPIRTAHQLAEIIAHSGLARASQEHQRHPATRVFQALRLVVNQELEQVEQLVHHVAAQCLKPGGRLVVITFHSLEDRLVKHAFREETLWQPTPKPVAASTAEQRLNPRSRSALLRAATRK